MDPRITKMAEVLVNYSTEVKKGDFVILNCAGLQALPLAKEVYRLCITAGADHVHVNLKDPQFDRIFYKNASYEQLDYFPQHEMDLTKKATVWIGIGAADNLAELSTCEPEKKLSHQKLTRRILDERVQNTRWVICRYPTFGTAQEAKMDIDEYASFIFSACDVDWSMLSKNEDILLRIMDKTSNVRIEGPDTNLNFSIKGIGSVKCDGKRNMPDGEVYTAPVLETIEGYITYNTPTIYNSINFDNVRFEFKKGKIVKATCGAGSNEQLNKILDTDEGSRFIGEFAVGVNPGIPRATRNILFDEKIFGSIHLTPGAAYENVADNGNRSAIHWDLVKILNDGSRLYFDDILIIDNGIFVHPELEGLNP